MSLLDYLEVRTVTIRDLPVRTSGIILTTICLYIGVINVVSWAYGAETNISSTHVENATGQSQNATLAKQSVQPMNNIVWGTIVGTIADSLISENDNNAHKANPTANNSGITSGIVLQWVGTIAPAAGLFFVGWQAMSTRDQLTVMKQQLGRAWIGYDGDRVPHMEPESKVVIFPYKNYGSIPAIIVKATSLSTVNLPTENQLRSQSPSQENMHTVLYPGATYEFRAHYDDIPYLGIFLEYEYADNLKGEFGFIVRVTYDPANPVTFSSSM
jgi:hypothetical protein